MKLQDLLDRFGTVQAQRDGWLARCPAHSDSQPSLRIAVTPDGTALIRCRAGCETQAVLASVGLSFAELRGVTDLGTSTISAHRQEELPTEEIARLRMTLDLYYNDLTIAVREYGLERFGLSDAEYERFGIGRAVDLPGGTRMVVPFCNFIMPP